MTNERIARHCETETKLSTVARAEVEAQPTTQTVDFEPGDPYDPLNWHHWYKWLIIATLTAVSAFVQMATVMAAPVAPQVERDLHTTPTATTLLVTIWELGEVIGPLLYGPLCERVGRLPVLHTTNALFVAFAIGCACSKSISTLIAMRFLSGASVAITGLGGGVLADLFRPDERALALSLMIIASQAGPAIGPIVGSYLGQSAGWRWAFWLTAITTGASSVLFLVIYRETYRVKVLERKVRAMRHTTSNMLLRSTYEQPRGEAALGDFVREVFRPVYLLLKSWALVGVSAFMSFFIGMLYIALTTISPVFQGVYGFSEGQTGLAFLGIIIGMVVGCVFNAVVIKRINAKDAREGEHNTDRRSAAAPEKILIPSVIAGVTVAAGFVLFGWAAEYKLHWMAPIVGTGLVGLGYFLVSLSVRAYIVETFGIWAVSACAAMLAMRNLVAALLPLLGPPLFQKLGLGWGCSLLALIGVALTPLPVLLIRYGPRMRAASTLQVRD